MSDARGQSLENAWEIQNLLQKVGAGDFSERCSDRLGEIDLSDPLGLVSMSIDMLVDDLESINIEAREKQQIIEANEKRFRLIVETMNEWIWEMSIDGIITYSSPSVKNILGYDPEEVVGKKMLDFIVDGEQDEQLQKQREIISDGKPFTGLLTNQVTRDGAIKIIESSGSAIHNENQELIGFVGSNRDITEKVQAENELRAQFEVINNQREAIYQLSTPILQVWEGILCLPVIGTVDTARSSQMTDILLEETVKRRSKGVIVDLTGIDVVDTKTADHLIKMIKAVKLLGAAPVLTGISPAIAQTLTHIGVEMADIICLRNLQDGLEYLLHSFKSDRSAVKRIG